MKPIARVYIEHVPEDPRKSIHNFTNNVGKPVVFVNDVLQGNVDRALNTTQCFVVNTTVGVVGFVDVAETCARGLDRVPRSPVLANMGETRRFNPSFDQAIIDAAPAEDPERYGAEYLNRWRNDLSGYMPRDLIEAAVDRGVIVRPPQAGIRYVAACVSRQSAGRLPKAYHIVTASNSLKGERTSSV